MKKITLICLACLLVSSFAFTQAQEPGFSNTVYTGVGTGSVRYDPVQGKDDAAFEGFTNYFTANVQASNGLTIAGDIAWVVFKGGLNAAIESWNFNAIMSPFANFDIGVGTNLDWEVGPKPFSGPNYAAYEVPEYAGLASVFNSPGVGEILNHFAKDAIAVQYAYEDILVVGAGLNGGISTNLAAGIGIKANIQDLFTLGFAYNGSFSSSGNNFYIGSSIYVVEGFDIDVWSNFDVDVNTSIGGGVVFYKDAFRFKPEFTITFWNEEGVSVMAALIGEMSITDDMLLGLNTSWGLGTDPDKDADAQHAGARLNISPHFVWNINSKNRLAVGINLMPVWWEDKTNEFFWSVPISWRVLF